MPAANSDKSYKELKKLVEESEKRNTDLIRKTIEITEMKAELEDRNYDLKLANEEILKLLQIKTDFLNQAAHDLRTPLTPIINLLPLIKKKIKDKEVRNDLIVVENNSKYLKQIVDNLVSLIKQGSEERELYKVISVGKVVEEVVINEQKIFQLHKVKVTKKISANLSPVLADHMKLVEVLQNILWNATKFMPKGGDVEIRVYESNNFIYVKVKDSGIGMSKKVLSNAFEPLFKADKSRHTEGIGLGLSICKKIVGMFGGNIWARSHGRGKGSTITFRLPVSNKS